jgi:citrate synthase
MHDLREVGSVDHVPDLIRRAKSGEHKLMGFGHRIYKNYDPRATIIKQTTEDVFRVTGTNPLLDVAIAIERAALSDDYFVSRKLYPNVDFYSGLIYEALGLPMEMFTVFFATSRMAGWVAQWLEMIQDPEQKIARPRQLYTGAARRSVPAS